MQVAAEIFKAYDIRGIVETALTPAAVTAIGQAIGSEAAARGLSRIVIGRDGRLSGPMLSTALATGLQQAGMQVTDIGQVTTPMVYYAACELAGGSGVAVTGSHNPPEYNGLKMMLGGDTLAGDAIQALRRRIETGDLRQAQGRYRQQAIGEEYIRRIAQDVRLARPMTIAIDCGNGIAGAYAPALYRALGCRVIELFCDVDGHFPHHHPDPSVPANLRDLMAAVRDTEAEIGLAFDGDGDRLGVVAKDGRIIYPDRQLMLFAADILARHPGAEILFDVKSTRNLTPWIEQHGGRATMWKTGHSFMKAKMKETGALLAGEMSGHMFFKERWYGFDDGLYAGARLLEYLSRQADLDQTLHGLPDAVSTPELNIRLQEGEPHRLIGRLAETAVFAGAREVITVDGLRVEYPDGFGLMRASNTTPVIVLRFEADTPAALDRIQAQFRDLLQAAAPQAAIPF
jgi:phosphomannomutase / phosphoglucomutase